MHAKDIEMVLFAGKGSFKYYSFMTARTEFIRQFVI
jgi:hypothetical protein